MGFSKIKAQGQSQGHVTTTFMRYFLKKKHIITLLINTASLIWYIVGYITGYISQCIRSKLYL